MNDNGNDLAKVFGKNSVTNKEALIEELRKIKIKRFKLKKREEEINNILKFMKEESKYPKSPESIEQSKILKKLDKSVIEGNNVQKSNEKNESKENVRAKNDC